MTTLNYNLYRNPSILLAFTSGKQLLICWMLWTFLFIDQLSCNFIIIEYTPGFILIKFLLPGMEVDDDLPHG